MKNLFLLLSLSFFHFSFKVSAQPPLDAFITLWKTTDGSITIPTIGGGYFYNVTWMDLQGPLNGSASNITGDFTINNLPSGHLIQVEITGPFPRIYFNNTTGSDEIVNITQWGNNLWDSFGAAFSGCSNLIITATDVPDLTLATSMFSAFGQCFSLTTNTAMATWDMTNITDMSYMFFQDSIFNQDISNWNVSNVTTMRNMFDNDSLFNQDIGGWNVGNVTDMSFMFRGADSFNQNIQNWTVGGVTDMKGMFSGATSFNQDISMWQVGGVTDMSFMFKNSTSFNQDISLWHVDNVTTMYSMFADAQAFNQWIGNWNVGKVTDMGSMFTGATSFNQDIGSWDVGFVTDMSFMFAGAYAFNQNISNWNVVLVTDMNGMFLNSISFNQDIGNWYVSNVTDMSYMFDNAVAFNQDLSGWYLNNLTDASYMFNAPVGQGMSCVNFGETIKGWATNPNTPSGITLGILNRIIPSNYQVYIDFLNNNKGWTFNPSVGTCAANIDAFITKWISTDGTITIPTTGMGYNYKINWLDLDGNASGTEIGVTGDHTIMIPSSDTIWVAITGTFPRIYFNNVVGSDEIKDIVQWGNISWQSFGSAFDGCSDLIMSALDSPDLSGVMDMSSAFSRCSSLTTNAAMSGWDMSNIMNMNYMFYHADVFNQDIGKWDVSSVADMNYMFNYAGVFNQDIGLWNVSNVITMDGMFSNTTNFNQDISDWDVSSVQEMIEMFNNALAFDQDLGTWDLNSLTFAGFMFDAPTGQGMSCDNFGRTIKGWANNPNTGVDVSLGDLNRLIPSNYQVYVDSLENSKNWFFDPTPGMCAPLPIQFITFNAKCKKGRIELSWITSSETNNDFFTIERSTDAIDWETIETIDGTGKSNTPQEYSYMDTPYGILYSGQAFYYRLKQIDYDGDFTYSDIILVNCYGKESKGIQVFPNPSAGVFIVDGLIENSEISIINMKGEPILTTDAHTYVAQFKLNVPAGMYFLIVNSAEGTIAHKIIIEK